MAIKRHIFFLAALLQLVLCGEATGQTENLSDSIITPIISNDTQEVQDRSGGVKGLIIRSITVDPNAESLTAQLTQDETSIYAPYNGKIIDSIHFENNNIYNDIKKSFWRRLLNSVHVVTSTKTINRDLLFKEGDKLDADILMRNLFMLRRRNYLTTSAIDIYEYQSDTNKVEVVVKTYDKLSLGMGMHYKYDAHSSFMLSDNNILGTGQKLSVTTNYQLSNKSYGGNIFTLETPNIFGTFLSSEIKVGKDFDYSYLNLNVFKDFINPNDYGGGAFLWNESAPYDILNFKDSTFRVETHGYDLWLGVSRFKPRLNGSIYLTGRYFDAAFTSRPKVSANLNPAFHDRKGFLMGAGLYKERYFSTTRVYGYGIKEYLPAGFKVEATMGYVEGEFWNSIYLGTEYKIGKFLRSGGYIMGTLSLGGNVSTLDGAWHQGAFNARFMGFTRMLRIGNNGIRHFVTLDFTQGLGRLKGSNEIVRLTDEAEPRGFTEYVTGINRGILTVETVMFTQWKPAGFRTAVFGYNDFAFIGNKTNVFLNDFYTTFGLGARFKNEHLTFKTIELRGGIALCNSGYIKSSIFQFKIRIPLNQVSYRPSKPDFVQYK